ncbi:nucleotidyltransferase domain-containing protein [Caldanaerobius fijiensis]|nr:nucleotidyltransferase domain-containing protein [Caldanaerobius fijiensis]
MDRKKTKAQDEFIKICKENDIALAYLFGSQKENALRILKGHVVTIDDPLADIDVGVVFLKNIDEIKNRYKLYAKIYNEMEDIFKPYPLDLIFLQENNSIFQWEALKGICVYSISEEFKDEYEMMILRRAADFEYVLNKYTKEVLEKY